MLKMLFPILELRYSITRKWSNTWCKCKPTWMWATRNFAHPFSSRRPEGTGKVWRSWLTWELTTWSRYEKQGGHKTLYNMPVEKEDVIWCLNIVRFLDRRVMTFAPMTAIWFKIFFLQSSQLFCSSIYFCRTVTVRIWCI